ncbi:MAG TPA: hypothetical protein VMZ27_01505 [Candidatus Saccharimonadales bacterium]|nr:hypothetical protein [Candidatus Saccharimonadales bacterium]
MMTSFRRMVFGALMAFTVVAAKADDTFVYTVQINATVQSSPARITLNWIADKYGANSYTVYRKAKTDTSWGTGITLGGSVTSYVDNNVTVGSAYEYKIVKAASLGYTGYGYIYAGVDVPLVDNRGKVVLVVDNSFTSTLSNELARLQSDLTGDGWTVLRRDVSRNDTPANVKAVITSAYQTDPANVKAVFLFGHIPILRSGNLNVDGHQARPMPADSFYGDMDSTWNNPSTLPSDVELMVGRVDLWNMPGNGSARPWPSEQEMLRNYLNKEHKWRHKLTTVSQRAVLGNRFGDMNGEAFAASGFRNFDPLVGVGKTSVANEQDVVPIDQRWTSMMAAGSYLWSYGCGGGSFTSMSFMGTHGASADAWSTDIVDQDAKAVFVMAFGSWFGEWDSSDNLMRSVLATPSVGLTCAWAGRPHWFYHHMALGEPIGHSARLTMNNSGLYQNQANNMARGVHIALMGDPTLRMHQVAPPASVAALGSGATVAITWTPSSDTVAGYHVYRGASPDGPFTRLTTSLVTAMNFTDTTPSGTNAIYMVRAVKLESTPSGTYYDPSQGVFATQTSGSTVASPKVTISKGTGGMLVSWNSQTGTTYRVLCKDASTGNIWVDASGVISGLATKTTWLDTTYSTQTLRLYRVTAQ